MSGVLTIQILINGITIADSLKLYSIQTHSNASGIAQAQITFVLDVASGSSAIPSEADAWIFGDQLDIRAGYDSRDETIFKGILESKTFISESAEGSRLEIFCQDNNYEPIANNKTFEFKFGENVFSSRLTLENEGGFTGVVSTQGNSIFVPGMEVNLQNFGKDYDGERTISTVNHHINSGDWLSEIDLS
ncbi:MAG: hypothetical protein HWE21_02560 [Cytophagia bacterium]|nr:hypothetical protein [Cytophagia bacterium]